jgi:hypothetical protein
VLRAVRFEAGSPEVAVEALDDALLFEDVVAEEFAGHLFDTAGDVLADPFDRRFQSGLFAVARVGRPV